MRRHLAAIDQEQFARSGAAELRRALVVSDLFQPGKTTFDYWETDRTLIGGAMPAGEDCPLLPLDILGAATFSERREIGVINIGQAGMVTVDGRLFRLGPLDCVYIGRGAREVSFASADANHPAQFYLLSYPAHASHPTAALSHAEAARTEMGTAEKANRRTIFKYIHPGGVPSCQLVMGLTVLQPGSLWNTMPPHTHLRRSEVYLYFDLPKDEAVFHFAGRPGETRSLVIRDREAVLSPPWSIHCGVGTAGYTFIWGMGGENQEFADMDPVEIARLG